MKLILSSPKLLSRLNKKTNVVIVLICLLLFRINHVNSHEINKIHEFCLSALDYPGCVSSNSENATILSQDPWRRYGSINVNWANWRSKGYNHIAPAFNSKGNPIFIALNCQKSMINISGPKTSWKGWLPPEMGFERKLLSDYCKSLLIDKTDE